MISGLARLARTSADSPTGRAVLLYAVAFAFAGLTPFALLPVLTNKLEPAEFGQAASWIVAVTIAANLLGLTTHGLISVRYFKVAAADLRRIVGAGLTLVMATHLAALAYLTFAPDPIGEFTHLPLAFSFGAVAVAAVLNVNLIALALMQSGQKPGLYLAMRVLQSAAEIGGCLLLLQVIGGKPDARIMSYGVAVAASAFCGLACLALREPVVAVPDRASIRNAVAFGVPMVPHVVAGQLLSNVDRLMVSFVLGVDALGVFMVASQLGMAISLIVEPLNRALSPWLFRKLASGDVAIKRQIVRGTYLLFLGLLALSLLAAGIFWVGFAYLFGAQYDAARGLLVPIAMGMAFQGMYYGVVNYVFYAEATTRLSLVTTSVVTLGAALSFLLVDRFGLVGAAVSFMATNLTLFLAVWLLSHRVVPMPWFGHRIAAQ